MSATTINKIVDCVGQTEQEFVKELVQLKAPEPEGAANGQKLPNRDELYEQAVDLVVREGRGSVSLLQRGLGIGYGRAARLVDFMAEDGIVGQYNGSQAREVLMTVEKWEAMGAGGEATAATAAARPAPKPAKPGPAAPTPSKPRHAPAIASRDEEEAEYEEDELDESEDGSELEGEEYDESEEDAFAEHEDETPFDVPEQKRTKRA